MDDVKIDCKRIETPYVPALSETYDLIVRIAAKDKSALKALYHVAGGRVLATLNVLMVDQIACEDVLADVFVRIWREAHGFESCDKEPKEWLFGILRTSAQDYAASRADIF